MEPSVSKTKNALSDGRTAERYTLCENSSAVNITDRRKTGLAHEKLHVAPLPRVSESSI